MGEADLRRHLAEQTRLPICLVDMLTLDRGVEATLAAVERAQDGAIVLFDSLHDEHLATVGAVMANLQQRENRPLFVVGSSGIESALSLQWNADCPAGAMANERDATCVPGEGAAPILVLSGSRSPVTHRQIAAAVKQGFFELQLDVRRVLASADPAAELNLSAMLVAQAFEKGRSIVVHPNGHTDDRLAKCAEGDVGVLLARLLWETLRLTSLKRIVVAGGDTSGRVAREIGIASLNLVRPLERGAPLCVAHSDIDRVDGVEFIFKGGQIGSEDFFSLAAAARSGPRSRNLTVTQLAAAHNK
jgi:uncharacterized protein YgbK (DUF1537 family)